MIKLLQGDCLELMKDIKDKSIDMILCDLPYGTTHNKWDTVISLDAMWKQYNRIIKDNGVICLFSQMPFSAMLVSSNLQMYRYEWIWKKSNFAGFLNANKMPLKTHESINVFYKKLPTYNPQFTQGKPYKTTTSSQTANYGEFYKVTTVSDGRRYPIDVLEFKSERGLHPTQKPVALLEYLIKTYTNEVETVLDNCMGSGSSGVASIHTNRNFIGIELDKDYFDIAKKRIDAEQKEITLWVR